jgi:lipoprotein-anchoring transpeptidase ErfK/SrfK
LRRKLQWLARIIREDHGMTRSGWIAALRYSGMGVVAGVALTLTWTGAPGSPVRAQAAPKDAPDSSGTIALTVAGPGTSQLLYLIDTKNQAFAVYRVDPQELKGTVKLEAARQYRWDLKLGEFNNQPPEVTAVESMVGARRP